MSEKPTYEELEKRVLELEKAELERKRTEDLLKDEIGRWRILLEQSKDGIVVLDQNGKVYEANRRYADMLGYSMEEIHQLHVWDWDTQFSKEQLIEMIRSAVSVLAICSGLHLSLIRVRMNSSLARLKCIPSRVSRRRALTRICAGSAR